jgi:hypothetical protein
MKLKDLAAAAAGDMLRSLPEQSPTTRLAAQTEQLTQAVLQNSRQMAQRKAQQV